MAAGSGIPIPDCPDVVSDPSEGGGEWPIGKPSDHGEHELRTLFRIHACKWVSLQSPLCPIDKFVPTAPDRLGVGEGEHPHHPSRPTHRE
jgi:hypothetical protein